MPAVRRDDGKGSGRARRRLFAAAAAVACGLVIAFVALPRLLGGGEAAEPDLVPAAALAPAPPREQAVPETGQRAKPSNVVLAEPATGPCAVTGEVYLGPRQPAEGASVSFEEPGVKPRTAAADARGVFRIEGLPLGCRGLLRASLKGRADAVCQVQPLDLPETRAGALLLAKPVRVTVNVIGADDEPVADAIVEAYPHPAFLDDSWFDPQHALRDAPLAAESGVSAALGRVVFPALGEGAWTFVARKHGFLSDAAERRVEAAAASQAVTLRMAPASRLSGRVVDGGSNPLRGVIVWAESPRDGSLDPRVAAAADAFAPTKEDGTFVIHAVADGPVRLFVSLHGVPRAEYGVVRVPWSGALTLVLDGPRVEGVVRDADGNACAGALVTGVVTGEGGARVAAVRAVADAKGRYELATLVPALRLASVRVAAGDLALDPADPCGSAGGIPLVARATLRRDLALFPAARIAGRVTCAEVPVAGAEVLGVAGDAPGGKPAWARAATTDADGRYELAGPPAGWAEVRVAAPGLVASGVPSDWFLLAAEKRRTLPTSVQVRAAGTTTLDVAMEASDTALVAGLVVDNEGRPVQGAVVASFGSRTLCDADGGFVAPPGRVVAGAAGYVPTETDLDPAQAPPGGVLEIALARGAHVRGVTGAGDGRGASLDGVFVQVAPFRDVFPAGASQPDPAAWLAAARHPVGKSGSFDVRMDAASGGFVVRAGGAGLVAARPAIVSSDGTEDPRAIAIRLDRGATVKGTVIHAEDGHPVAGARVALRGAGGSRVLAAVTSSDGSFAIEGLPRGEQELSLTADGFLPTARRVTAPTDDVVVALAVAQAIEGSLVLHDGTPLADCAIAAQQEGLSVPPIVVRTDESGRFRAEPLAPGVYTVTATVAAAAGRSLRPTTRLGGVRAGAADLRIVVAAAPSVAGVVLGEDGAPIEGACVAARSAATGRVSDAAPTGADGRFEIVGLDDGEHRITVRPPASRGLNGARFVLNRALLPAEVAAAQDARDLVVTLLRGLTIEGVARIGDRSPLRGGVVVAEPTAGASDEVCAAVTGPDGSFSITGLAPGTYRLGRTELDRPGRPATFAGGESVEAGLRGVELVAGSSVTLRGRVVDEQGMPIPGARVQARPRPRGRPLAATARQDGVFSIEGAVSGVDYDVEAWTPDHAPFVVQGVSSAGATARIVLRRGLEASGKLVDGDGKPVPGAELTFETEGTGVKPTAVTDAEGRFAVRGLLAGSYRASVATRTMQSTRMTFVPCGSFTAGATDVELRSPR